MLIYHRTSNADAILRQGFRESALPFGGGDPALNAMRGVFVSAPSPLDENEGAKGNDVMEIDVPESVFAQYELVQEGLGYREAMIPVADLKSCRTRRLSEDEVDELEMQRWSAS